MAWHIPLSCGFLIWQRREKIKKGQVESFRAMLLKCAPPTQEWIPSGNLPEIQILRPLLESTQSKSLSKSLCTLSSSMGLG